SGPAFWAGGAGGSWAGVSGSVGGGVSAGGGVLRGGSGAGSGVLSGRSCGSAIPAAPLPFLVGCPGAVELNPSCQSCVCGFAGVGQGLFRMDHSAAPPTRITAPRTKGQIGTSSPELSAGCADGPGVPVPAAVSRNAHDPEATCPSADVTR